MTSALQASRKAPKAASAAAPSAKAAKRRKRKPRVKTAFKTDGVPTVVNATVERSTADPLLRQLQDCFDDKTPSVDSLQRCSNDDACAVLAALSRAHDDTLDHDPEFLRHYSHLAPALLATLPSHARFLETHALCVATRACGLMAASARDPDPADAAFAADARAADHCLHAALVPELRRRLRGQGPRKGIRTVREYVAAAGALAALPRWLGKAAQVPTRQWQAHPATPDFVHHMRFHHLVELITYLGVEPHLVSGHGEQFRALMQRWTELVAGGAQPLAAREACQALQALARVRAARSDVWAFTFFSKHRSVSAFRRSFRDTIAVAFEDEGAVAALPLEALQGAAQGVHATDLKDPPLRRTLLNAAVRFAPGLSRRAALDFFRVARPREAAHARLEPLGVPADQLRTLAAAATAAPAEGEEEPRLWAPHELWAMARVLLTESALPVAERNAALETMTQQTQWSVEEGLREMVEGGTRSERLTHNGQRIGSVLCQLWWSNAPRPLVTAVLGFMAAQPPLLFGSMDGWQLRVTLRVCMHSDFRSAPFFTILLGRAVELAAVGSDMTYAVYAAAKLGDFDCVSRLLPLVHKHCARRANMMSCCNALWGAAVAATAGAAVDADAVRAFQKRVKSLLVTTRVCDVAETQAQKPELFQDYVPEDPPHADAPEQTAGQAALPADVQQRVAEGLSDLFEQSSDSGLGNEGSPGPDLVIDFSHAAAGDSSGVGGASAADAGGAVQSEVQLAAAQQSDAAWQDAGLAAGQEWDAAARSGDATTQLSEADSAYAPAQVEAPAQSGHDAFSAAYATEATGTTAAEAHGAEAYAADPEAYAQAAVDGSAMVAAAYSYARDAWARLEAAPDSAEAADAYRWAYDAWVQAQAAADGGAAVAAHSYVDDAYAQPQGAAPDAGEFAAWQGEGGVTAAGVTDSGAWPSQDGAAPVATPGSSEVAELYSHDAAAAAWDASEQLWRPDVDSGAMAASAPLDGADAEAAAAAATASEAYGVQADAYGHLSSWGKEAPAATADAYAACGAEYAPPSTAEQLAAVVNADPDTTYAGTYAPFASAEQQAAAAPAAQDGADVYGEWPQAQPDHSQAQPAAAGDAAGQHAWSESAAAVQTSDTDPAQAYPPADLSWAQPGEQAADPVPGEAPVATEAQPPATDAAPAPAASAAWSRSIGRRGRVPRPEVRTELILGSSTADPGDVAQAAQDTAMRAWLLPSIAWAVAALHGAGHEAEAGVVSFILDNIETDSLSPIDFTNVLHAAEATGVQVQASQPFALALKRALSRGLGGWQPAELATVAYCLGCYNIHPGAAVLDGIAARLLAAQRALPVKHLVNGYTGLYYLGHMPPRAAPRRLEERMLRKIDTATPDELTQVLLLCTRIAYEPTKLLEVLENGGSEVIAPLLYSPAACVKVCMCIATFGSRKARLFAAAMMALAFMPPDTLPPGMQLQITQAYHIMRACGMEAPKAPGFVHKRAQAIMNRAALKGDQQHAALKALVRAALRSMHPDLARTKPNARAPQGPPMHVDVLLPGARNAAGQCVAVEMLHKNDVSSNTREFFGQWLLRRRQLAAGGCHAVGVPVDTFSEAGHAMRQSMLRQALRACGCTVPTGRKGTRMVPV